MSPNIHIHSGRRAIRLMTFMCQQLFALYTMWVCVCVFVRVIVDGRRIVLMLFVFNGCYVSDVWCLCDVFFMYFFSGFLFFICMKTYGCHNYICQSN